jgi:hypothetical protein
VKERLVSPGNSRREDKREEYQTEHGDKDEDE